MYKVLFLTVIFSLLSSIIFPQSPLLEIQKHLPELIQHNPELLKQVTSTLQRDIVLNPDLVAYRIRYYKNLFDDGILDNDQNGFNNLRLLTAYYYKKRNNWLENEKKIIIKSNYLEIYKQNALSLLDSYFMSITENLDYALLDMEKNLVDYYAAIALGSENLGNFNPSIDYSTYRYGYSEVIINSFIEKRELLKKGVSVDQPFEKIITYWYLFPNDNGEVIFSPGIYFMEFYRSEYTIEDFNRIGFYVGSSLFHLKETIDVNSQDSFIPSESLLGEIRNSTLFNIAASYRFLLTESIGPASFISIAITGGLSLDPNQSKIDSLIVYKREPLPNNGFISDTWDVDVLDITDVSRTSISLKATMPVLFFKKDLFIEIGFISGYNFATYTLKYQYQYTKTKVEWDSNFQRFFSSNLDRQISGPISERYSSSKFIFYPNVDLTMQSYKPLVLQVSLGYNYTSLNVGITF